MIHMLNYHDKWPMRDYKVTKQQHCLYLLLLLPSFADDKAVELGEVITCQVILWSLMCWQGGETGNYNYGERVKITIS